MSSLDLATNFRGIYGAIALLQSLYFIRVLLVAAFPKSETFKIFTEFTSSVVCSSLCLRIATCLGTWFSLLGHWNGLGGFTRELYDLNCPICLQFFAFRLCSSENVKNLDLGCNAVFFKKTKIC